MVATMTQSIQSPEELEAQLQEGMAPISAEGLALKARYHELAQAANELKAAQEAVKELLIEEMENKGAYILTHNGVPVISYDKTTSKKVAHAQFIADHPDIYAEYVTVNSDGRRFDAKNPLV